MANFYQVGDLVRVTGTFTTLAGAATDPTSVFFSFKTPSGTITIYQYGVDAQVIKSGTGIYYVDVSVTAPGNWNYRFYSTGTGQTADESYFSVPYSQFV